MASSKNSSGYEKANKDENAHIPFSLRDPVLLMSSDEAYTGNVPTIFVGVVDEDYTEEMWNNHATRIMQLFKFDIKHSHFIKVKGERSKSSINSDQMGEDVSEAIEKINSLEQTHNYTFNVMRIVGMGIHSAIGVHIALEALVKGWNLQWNEKAVQFVALGDSVQGSYLNFCKSLCLKKICAEVQFYKTMDYDQFGYFLDDKINQCLVGTQSFEKFMSHVFAGSEPATTLNKKCSDVEALHASILNPPSLKQSMLIKLPTQVHIPFLLEDSVIRMSSINALTENIPTIFIGVVDEDYTEAMWNSHTQRIARLFKINNDFVCYIKVKREENNFIDADQMGREVLEAIQAINTLQEKHNATFKAMRIVGMGIHSAIGVYIALEALVKKWDQKWNEKVVQFVALGDSVQGSYLNFCKSLCLKKICAKVHFYRTMDYDQFGNFRDDQINQINV